MLLVSLEVVLFEDMEQNVCRCPMRIFGICFELWWWFIWRLKWQEIKHERRRTW